MLLPTNFVVKNMETTQLLDKHFLQPSVTAVRRLTKTLQKFIAASTSNIVERSMIFSHFPHFTFLEFSDPKLNVVGKEAVFNSRLTNLLGILQPYIFDLHRSE